jgi:radical SAM protein with 4Fe4S-binding SPASM domain
MLPIIYGGGVKQAKLINIGNNKPDERKNTDMENRDHFLKELDRNLVYKDFPPQIILETTAFCNMKCIHCGHKTMERPKGNMNIQLYKKIIDEIARVNPDTELWMTYYGEALLLKYKLYYMIKYAKEKGLRYIVLNTNGMLLDDEMGDLIIESGLDRFIFSIDGFTTETYEKIRVGGKRDIVYNNIININNKIKQRNLKKPYLEVQFSIMEENEHELEAFLEFWRKEGIYIKLREKLTWGGTVEANNLDVNQARIACPWAVTNCAVTWSGDLVACAVDYNGKVSCGNLWEFSIKELWNGSHQELVRLHMEHRFDQLPELCRNCLDWQAVGAETYDGYGKIDWKQVILEEIPNP